MTKKIKKDFTEYLDKAEIEFSNNKSPIYDPKVSKIWAKAKNLAKDNDNKVSPALFVSTPEGRAFLRNSYNSSTSKKNEKITEIDILRFAFTAELIQIEEITLQDAAMLVKHGITLRDIKHKKPEVLADQRWEHLAKSETPDKPLTAGTIAAQLLEPDFESSIRKNWKKSQAELSILTQMENQSDNIKPIFKAIAKKEPSLREELRKYELEEIKPETFKQVAQTYIKRTTEKGISVEEAVEPVVKDFSPLSLIHASKQSLESNTKQQLKEDFDNWREKTKEAKKNKIDLNQVQFYDLLAVSDFHLAAGNHPTHEGIARFSPTEDFYFDGAFFRFLYYTQIERLARGGYPYELVFNGDMADFAQIVVPATKKMERKPLIPWPIPPLRYSLSNDGNSNGSEVGEEESLQVRLFKILKDFHGYENLKAAVKEQVKSLKRAEDNYGTKILIKLLKEVADGSYDQGEDWMELEDLDRNEQFLYNKGFGRKWIERADLYTKENWHDRDMSNLNVLAMRRSEALDQLADLYRGHKTFFQALAWFLAQGNRLVLVRGNHDPQWYWPEVQLAFIGWLHKAYSDVREICKHGKYEFPVRTRLLKRRFPSMTLTDFEKRVNFDHSWFYYRERLAYLEHGGQQEAVDSQRFFLLPVYHTHKKKEKEKYELDSFPKATTWLPVLKVSPAEKEIEPPIGSLGLVFLVNNLETQFPNFERPGYDKVYLNYLQYSNPRLIWDFAKALWKTVKFWVRWALLPLKDTLIWGATRLSNLKHPFTSWQAQKHDLKLNAYAQLSDLPEKCVRDLDQTRWVRIWRRRFTGYLFTGFSVLLGLAVLVVPLLLIAVSIRELMASDGLLNYILKAKEWFPILDNIIPSPGVKRVVDYVGGGIITFLLGFGSYWLLKSLRDWIGLGEDFLFKPSKRVAKILAEYSRDVPYIIFGHDHGRNVQRLPAGNKSKSPETRPWYLNTGTWMYNYEKDRKRLFRESHEYPFVRMLDTHRILASGADPNDYMIPRPETRPLVELLRWKDDVLKVESCETFMGTKEGKH